MGRLPADLLVTNGRWVCVQTGEIIPGTDLAVIDGRIAYVGEDGTHTRGENTKVVDANNLYLVPGLLDGHMHVESGMLTVSEFVRAVAPHGTTGMFIDPHEIANVFGMPGIRLMVDEAGLQPIHVWVEMPSCVPSAPGLETPGAVIGPADVAEAMTWPGIIGLGEMMNFPGVYNSEPKIISELETTLKAGKAISGHYPSTDLGLPFHGYVAGGPEDDHEGTRLEDAVMRARQGMRVMMRYGSAWQDVAEQVKAVTQLGLDPRHFILCTDDCHSATLVNEGHIDRVLRHAIDQGLDPMVAIQMATINTAEYYGLEREIGSIAPGRFADFILTKDLRNFHADTVYCHGQVVAKDGKMQVERPIYDYPGWATHSIHFPRQVSSEDFSIISNQNGSVRVNVIGVIENQAPTRHIKKSVPVERGQIRTNPTADLAKIALLERHTGSGRIQVGLVSGFGFSERCAVATTVAHDCHQMIVVGTDEADMAAAANHLISIQGGQVVVKDGEIIGEVHLPIAGLMSDQPAENVADQAGSVLVGFRACGCKLNNPNMQLSLLALVVIPELRISDLGLVDVQNFRFIPVVE
jgi:adenine deaminase